MHTGKSTLVWLCLFSLGAGFVGCSKTYDGDQRFAISGNVKVDGQPLDLGVIRLMPEGGEKGSGRVAGSPIRDGVYTIEEENGPTAGKYRVEILWNKRTGKKVPNPMDPGAMIDEMTQGLPDKYHKNSELTADVSAEKTTFDFELATK